MKQKWIDFPPAVRGLWQTFMVVRHFLLISRLKVFMAILYLFPNINIVFKPKELLLFSKACLGHLGITIIFFFSFHSCFTQQVLAVYVAPERVCGKPKHNTLCKPSPLLLMWWGFHYHFQWPQHHWWLMVTFVFSLYMQLHRFASGLILSNTWSWGCLPTLMIQ